MVTALHFSPVSFTTLDELQQHNTHNDLPEKLNACSVGKIF